MTLRSHDDVTDSRRRSQRMEALGLLAVGVVHDVNNLLTIIGNYAAFAADTEASSDLPDEVRWRRLLRDIGQIQRAATRGSELTRKLLEYARTQPTVETPLAVNEAVEETLQLLRGAIGQQIEVVTQLDASCWPVLIDKAEFGQVMVNLVVNARDAMPSGGTLTVRTENVRGDADDRCVRITVADSGTGIASAVLSQVFEPFFSTKPAGRGSGLGLAVVRDVVAAARGEVSIVSDPGSGATIELLFPAASGEVKPV